MIPLPAALTCLAILKLLQECLARAESIGSKPKEAQG